MDGTREVEQQQSSPVDDDESDAEETSPYLSDTENIDLDEFVASLPRNVNDWQIYDKQSLDLEIIGNGFFGEIYKATDRGSGNVMVMKSIKKVGKVKLFCTEIRLMCTLKHPNILRFLGVCLYNSTINLMTEYMNVGTLEEVVLNLSEPLLWSLRMRLAHDIAMGMEYLHQRGVIHRDLASKNVLISNKGDGYQAVVADFGLAAKIPSRKKKKLLVVGSPYWMAPEVLRRDCYNQTVDIFSYGIILCEIIGRVQSSPDDIPRTNDFGLDVDKFREQVEGCPPEFLQLAVCCCQLEPESRPPFDITAKYLAYIRQFSINEDFPVKLVSYDHSSSRRSANIEDWLIDKKKMLDVAVNVQNDCYARCDCENIIGYGVAEKDRVGEQPISPETPCKSRRSSKRNSFFSVIRYKYFKPTVVTEDLVQNTPSKLASFFNRVLHVQKKHKFEKSRKHKSKLSSDVDTTPNPRLRTFRFIGEDGDTIANGARQLNIDSDNFDETQESPRGLTLSNGVSHENEDSGGKLPVLTLPLSPGLDTENNTNPTEEQQWLEVPDDMPSSRSSSAAENDLLMSWPQKSFYELDRNGDFPDGIPRCHSESNVVVKNVQFKKLRSFSTSQQPSEKKLTKQWSFLNLFRRHAKEKNRSGSENVSQKS